jgi:hypothetical protein
MWLRRVNSQCPTTLAEMEPVHGPTAITLKKLAAHARMPHLIVYGPAGCGKRSLARALVKECFATRRDFACTRESWILDTESGQLSPAAGPKLSSGSGSGSGKCVGHEVTLSSYHCELDVAPVAWQAHKVVAAWTHRLTTEPLGVEAALDRWRARTSSSGSSATSVSAVSSARWSHRVLVLHHVDQVPADVQHALRRIMERYAQRFRVVFVVNDLSPIIAPLRSRCAVIPVRVPSEHCVHAAAQQAWQAWAPALPWTLEKWCQTALRWWKQLLEQESLDGGLHTHLRCLLLRLSAASSSLTTASSLVLPVMPAQRMRLELATATKQHLLPMLSRGLTACFVGPQQRKQQQEWHAQWSHAVQQLRQSWNAWCATGCSPHVLLWHLCMEFVLCAGIGTNCSMDHERAIWHFAALADMRLTQSSQAAIQLESCVIDWWQWLEGVQRASSASGVRT